MALPAIPAYLTTPILLNSQVVPLLPVILPIAKHATPPISPPALAAMTAISSLMAAAHLAHCIVSTAQTVPVKLVLAEPIFSAAIATHV